MRLILVAFVLALAPVPSRVARVDGPMFSPRGGCLDLVTGIINRSRSEVLILAYSFTSRPVLEAIERAEQRGIQVRVVADAGSNRNPDRSVADDALAAGAEVRLDGKHAIMHQKVLVAGRIVVTGSWNFSESAEIRNSENLVAIHSVAIAADYREEFERHWEHSEPLEP